MEEKKRKLNTLWTNDLESKRMRPELVEQETDVVLSPSSPVPTLGSPTTFQATTPRNKVSEIPLPTRVQATEVGHYGTHDSSTKYTDSSEDGKSNGREESPVEPERKHSDNTTERSALLGYWKHSPHLRLKVVPYKRDGEPVQGDSPSKLGVYHVKYNQCVFEPSLEDLTRTEMEEYCRIRAEHNDVGQAIGEAKRRVAIDAEGLNSAQFDEKIHIRRANQRTGSSKSAANKTTVWRLGSKEAQYTATASSAGGPETSQQTSDFESEDDVFGQTSEFEPSTSDEDISASENTNEHQALGSLQKPSQNDDLLSGKTIVIEGAGHEYSKRGSRSGYLRGGSMAARSKLPTPQKITPRKLIVKLRLPSLTYSNGSLKYQKATPVGPVREAIGLVLKDFDDLPENEMVAAINAVRRSDVAFIFLLLSKDKHKLVRRSWLLEEVKTHTLGISS